jgi:hypothetical protein
MSSMRLGLSRACMTAVGICLLGGAQAALAFEGDINTPSCPNVALAGFAPTLSDCRAFERVSPSFQNGVGKAETVAVAPSEPRILASSIETFGGAESNALGPTYEMFRGANSWETKAIAPPATLYPANEFFAASTDLSKSVWALRTATQSLYADTLYLRGPNGEFVEIGPMEPPALESGPPAGAYRLFLGAYSYVGASRDLSHVYFQAVNGRTATQVWPGDTTALFPTVQGASLYEYVGVGNKQPRLVGVDGQNHVISECATYLGSDESSDTYNAVSDDAAHVVFTAEGRSVGSCGTATGASAPAVTEVYDRLAGVESVPISEPRAIDCSACLTTTRAAAEFQGASADGTKVFFTTAQELLPGDEGLNLYEFDFDRPQGSRVLRVSGGSAPEVHHAEVEGVVRVSQDGSHVYFVAQGKLTEEARGGGCVGEESPGEKAEEETTKEGRCRAKLNSKNLYVVERDQAHPTGRIAFVATLAAGDTGLWSTVDSRPVQATPTGRYLVLQSGGALTPDVSGEAPQMYEYDSNSEELVRISRGQTGYPQGTANANASYAVIPSQGYLRLQLPTAQDTFLAVAEDGATVTFATPAALSADATVSAEAGAESIYEYRSAGTLKEGNVFLLSGGHNLLSDVPQGLNQAGQDIFFKTADSLVASDDDEKFDIYDVRADGGFLHAEAPVCSGEGCLSSLPPPAPPLSPPASLTITPEPVPTAPVVRPPVGQTPRVQAQSRSLLTRALKQCRRKHRRAARIRCERVAQRRYRLRSASHVSTTAKKGRA